MKTDSEKQTEPDGFYNPFEHRVVEKPNSDFRSAANLIKASLGSGILAIPLAFHNSGWAVGIVGTIVIGAICGHCVQILKIQAVVQITALLAWCAGRCYAWRGDYALDACAAIIQNDTQLTDGIIDAVLVETSRRCCKAEQVPLLGYADTCKAAFANGPKSVRKYAETAKVFANASLTLTHIGICCVFTVLIADSVKQLVDKYYPDTILSVETYCLILLVPLLILTQIKYLKWLAPLSMIANILLIFTFAICLYYIFGGTLKFEGRHVVGDIHRFPAFLSTVIFAMEGIGVVMPIENNMKKPQHFIGCPSVLTIAMALIVTLYTIMGLFGYLRYGEVLRGSITLNLPMDDWPAVCAKAFIAIVTLFTYPLQYYVIIDIFMMYVTPHLKDNYKNPVEMVARAVGVFICVGLSLALPMLEQVISIVGSFFYSILGLINPCIIETVSRWDDLGRYNWILWKNILIIIFGFVCMISGVALTVSDIIRIENSKTH